MLALSAAVGAAVAPPTAPPLPPAPATTHRRHSLNDQEEEEMATDGSPLPPTAFAMFAGEEQAQALEDDVRRMSVDGGGHGARGTQAAKPPPPPPPPPLLTPCCCSYAALAAAAAEADARQDPAHPHALPLPPPTTTTSRPRISHRPRAPIDALPDAVILLQLLPRLAPRDRKALRGACRRARLLANAAVTAVALTADSLGGGDEVAMTALAASAAAAGGGGGGDFGGGGGLAPRRQPSLPGILPSAAAGGAFGNSNTTTNSSWWDRGAYGWNAPANAATSASCGTLSVAGGGGTWAPDPRPATPPASASDPATTTNLLHQLLPLLGDRRFPKLAAVAAADGASAPLSAAALAAFLRASPVTLARLRALDLKRCHYLGRGLLSGLVASSCPRLERLAAPRWACNGALWEVGRLSSLAVLDLGDADVDILTVDDVGLSALAAGGLPRLRALSLRRCRWVSDQGCQTLSRVSTLRALDLSHTDVGARGLVWLGALPDLEALAADGCRRVDDAALAAGAPALAAARGGGPVALSLRNAGGVSNAGLRHLCHLRRLRALDLGSGFELDDVGLAALAGVSLARAGMGGGGGPGAALAAAAQALFGVGGLARPSSPSPSPHDYANPASSSQPGTPRPPPAEAVPLEYLSAGSFNLSGLPPRAFGARLTHLSFGGGFACKGLRFLFPLPRLASLHVQGIGVVTDLLLRRVGLVQASLERLALRSGYGLSAGALDALAPLHRLEALSLAACPGVPAERVAQFVADHPRLGRLFRGPCPLAPAGGGGGDGGGGGGGGGASSSASSALYAVPADDCGGGVCGTTVVRRTPEQRREADREEREARRAREIQARLREPLRPLPEEEEVQQAGGGGGTTAAAAAAAARAAEADAAAADAAEAAAQATRPPKPPLHGYGGSFAALFDVAAPDPVSGAAAAYRLAVGHRHHESGRAPLASASHPQPFCSPPRWRPVAVVAAAGGVGAGVAAGGAAAAMAAAAAAAARQYEEDAAALRLTLPCARASLAACASHGGCGMSWVTPGSTPIPLPPPRKRAAGAAGGGGGAAEGGAEAAVAPRQEDVAVATAAAIMAAAALNVPM
jgi:hypothetical protein